MLLFNWKPELIIFTDGKLGNVIREGVNVMREKESAEQEPADGPEGAHAVDEADVDGRRVPLDVIVDVRRA